MDVMNASSGYLVQVTPGNRLLDIAGRGKPLVTHEALPLVIQHGHLSPRGERHRLKARCGPVMAGNARDHGPNRVRRIDAARRGAIRPQHIEVPVEAVARSALRRDDGGLVRIPMRERLGCPVRVSRLGPPRH